MNIVAKRTILENFLQSQSITPTLPSDEDLLKDIKKLSVEKKLEYLEEEMVECSYDEEPFIKILYAHYLTKRLSGLTLDAMLAELVVRMEYCPGQLEHIIGREYEACIKQYTERLTLQGKINYLINCFDRDGTLLQDLIVRQISIVLQHDPSSLNIDILLPLLSREAIIASLPSTLIAEVIAIADNELRKLTAVTRTRL